MKRVMLTIGTRPEMIKLAPVVLALRERSSDFETHVLFTGQHRELLDQMAHQFGIEPDDDLQVMRANQSLPALTSRLIEGIDARIDTVSPDVVLSQGDTTTVLATALCCYYHKIRFGHVEAGLRTGDLFAPFPEEGNRRLTSPLTHFHFAPTERSRANLLREGIDDSQIYVTGNTVVDALQHVAKTDVPLPFALPSGPIILVTLHRRESFGPTFVGILEAIRDILAKHPEVTAIYPVHPNPNVVGPAQKILGPVKNALLVPALGYAEFITVMKRATLLLSDSGGVQEEAPSLGVPLLVLRDTTERPEGVEAGVAKLVGTDGAVIRESALELLSDAAARAAMTTAHNPYGDGQAGRRIVEILHTR